MIELLPTTCSCDDWKPNIDALNGPFVLQSIRQPGSVRPVKQFVYCPWCGLELYRQCRSCGALMKTEEEAVKHYSQNDCCVKPAPVPVLVPAPDERNRCRVCGTPTFGLYCAKHSKGGMA